MSQQTALETEIATLIVEALEIEDVSAHEIVPGAALFGNAADSLGLDSIDALEIALAVSQRYGVELRGDDENKGKIFASLQALSAHIASARSR